MSFIKITSDDNWFKTHPYKIAGEEFKSTSIFFPIQVKGTKQDVLRVTGVSLDKKDDRTRRLKIAKAKAKALRIKIQIDEEI